jgi:pimeloyl-ACP methyl ester carboxylesterase
MSAPEGAGLPHFFGDPDQPVFGWWHAAERPRDVAVLVCPPFGREEASCHRALRVLAIRLAAAGLPTLRFDYVGCGDSSGDESMENLTQAWSGSIDAAIDELRRLSGARRVCLVGVRLGAALGACVAARRGDVWAYASIAAVTSGRSFVREQKILQAASVAPGSAPPEADLLEAGGYALDASTREALAAVDLKSLACAPGEKMLIIDRDDMAPAGSWVEHLRSLGAHVDHRQLPGYADMMQDPHNTRIPMQMLDALVSWLSAISSVQQAAPPATALCTSCEPQAGIVERAVWIDAGPSRLFGIASLPAHGATPSQAVLLINAGAQHHIGPSRMYVTLARRWAQAGTLVLRLDLSGVGDSPTRNDARHNDVYSPFAADEVIAVARHVRREWRLRHCHVAGLCSGAYHGFKAAVSGAMVDNAVIINPLTFFWHEGTPLDAPLPDHQVASEIVRYRSSLFSIQPWLKLVRGDVDLRRLSAVIWRRLLQSLAGHGRDLARFAGIPLRDDLARELQQATKRQIGLHFVFSEGEPGEDLLRTQGGLLVDKLCRTGVIDIHRIAQADHTFTGASARATVMTLLTGWVLAWAAAANEANAAEIDTQPDTLEPAVQGVAWPHARE